MKDNAEGMTLSRPQTADAMTKIHPVTAARTLHGAMVNSESDSISLAKRHHLSPALHSGALLGQDKLTAGEIPPWFR